MSCGIVICPVGRAHHHHRRHGAVLPAACFCTRPETIHRPTVVQLIDFAAAHPGKLTSATSELVRTQLGITPVRYLQLLAQAIDDVVALEHDPITTRRLRREADQRARTRATRTTGR